MNISGPSLSLNSTKISNNVDNSEDMDATIKNYAREMLKSRIFLGRYLERRLVNESVGYRDVVLLSAAEQELKRDLIVVRQKLRSSYPDMHWIGITDGEEIGFSDLCLWTEIDNQPFGAFWFQIRNVKFREQEVLLTLKCIRHITDAFLELEPILTGLGTKTTMKKTVLSDSSTVLNETYNIITTLKSALTIRNVAEFLTFLSAFVIAVVTGSSALINFLGNFVLALIRELSYFIKNSTPLFLGFLDFMSKIIGGFYILMAMIFKPNRPSAPYPSRRPITYHESYTERPYASYDDTYDPKSFD